ncbi:MAG TPA: serine/threonine-protein kinase [Xanthomonadaceae bacterium]|jgi:non-specific serine/threonine protein kinase/serine/threonine-protein kinase
MAHSGSSRTERLDQLLEAALDLEGDERARFLASDAVSPELRDELVELLDAAGAANPLDRASADLLSVAADLFHHTAAATSAAVGQRIGRYRLLRQLGEGGTATVWLAERDDDSFNHKVAVKCLKTGLATAESRARFLREQQILAQLQHPHIARLYDAGISSEGVPFIVMEWVDGLSLTRYCDHHLLGIVPRLQLFQKVCAAVAFAHQNLIVHRDLKPGNILVGADGEPKLLDFGIAKLLDDSSEPMTRSGVRMLTPDYAAPEQFSGAPITTATDVYALGIVLYELLCGLRPRQIAHSSPHSGPSKVTAPSEALRRLSDTMTPSEAREGFEPADIARSRMSTPERLRAGLRGDLDTIVLKASQDEPSRRYATVAALGEDIQRYLRQQPIRARPDSLSYRAGKFVRRHALGVAAALATSLALVGGLVVSIRQTAIAEQERRHAESERKQADQRFEDVQSLAHAMIFDLNDVLMKLPGSTPARSLLVKQALTYLRRLGEQRDAALPLRRELAQAWLRVGDVQGAPSMSNLGDIKGAQASYAQASDLVDSLLREAPHDPAARELQAQLLLHRTDVMAMTPTPIESDIAGYRKDIALWEQLQKEGLHDAKRGLANAQTGLANELMWSDKQNDALPLYKTAQATVEAAGPGADPTQYASFLGRNAVHQGDALNGMGRHAEAAPLIRQGLERLQALQRSQPDDPAVTSSVAWASQSLGDVLYYAPDKAARLPAYETARAAFAKLLAADPADHRARRGLALCEEELGDALYMLKRYDDAMAHYRSALQAQQDLQARASLDQDTLHEQGNILYDIANLYKEQHQRDEALAAFRKALTLRQSLVAQDPGSPILHRDVARVLADMADEESDRTASCHDWLASEAEWKVRTTQGNLAPVELSERAPVYQHAAACR